MPHPLTVYKASAGSGKTFTLATQYIKLLVKNPQQYRHILAVTFTNKATEEMKMRILSQLYGIWRQLPASSSYASKVYADLGGELSEPQIAERAGQALHLLLHNYSYFRVETIDSFFQSVLRNLARELNLTANLRVGLNDVQVEELAVDKLIDALGTTDQLLQWLMRYIMDNISDDRSWNVIGQVKKFGRTIFHDYYKSHSEQLNSVMHQPGFFDDYQEQLRRLRQQSLQRMQSISRQFFEELEQAGLTIGDLSYGTRGVGALFMKIQDGIFDESIITKRATDCVGVPEKWCSKTSPHRALITDLATTTLDGLLRQAIDEQPRQWKLYKSADLTLRHLSQLRLLGSIEQKVRQLNDDQNRFLLSDTQQLLHQLINGSDTPFIYDKIGTQLEHIMIDEFQDTSTVQWQNFKILLQETMSRQGAENLIVGDVKQSIYRWRSGDWRLLAGITGQFVNSASTVRVQTLDTNYRSARRIVRFNNAFFSQAAVLEQVDAYDDVEQQVPDGKPDTGYVEVRLLPSDGDYEQLTLNLLCLQVQQLLSAGTPPSDVAILVRSNNHIPVIASYFSQQLPGVKVVSDEAFRLDASTAVLAIVNALRCLVHPDDHIARACLHSTLTHLSAASLDDGDILSPTLLQLPLSELADQLYIRLQLQQLGNQSAYLCAFFDQVSAFSADYGSDVDAFLRQWDQDLCSKTIQSPQNDGLRLISIHKSKGLEFPCVLIPFCDWRLELPDVLWCSPSEAPFSRLPLVPVDFSQKGMKGTIYEADYEEEHRQNIVDNLNLLYVAFTRASSRLFVYGRRGGGAASRSALIQQLMPVVADALSDAQLSGSDDEAQPLVFTYGSNAAPAKASPSAGTPVEADSSTNGKGNANPFLQPSLPLPVAIDDFPATATFRQSNQSRQFAAPDDEPSQQQEYITTGNVLHSVLSTIRDTTDVEQALGQLQQQGILYSDTITPERLATLLRQRLSSPQVALWFQPGRWQLFNECTILSVDDASGRVVERRPDRVMTDGQQTIVVDFKFGRMRPEYQQQVLEYMHLLTTMGYPCVKGYIWLVYTNDIIEVI